MARLKFEQIGHTSLVMRNTDFYICENKDADQLRSNREADQRLCFRYTVSTIPLLPKSVFCGCTAWFVSDLVGNPEDLFSHDEAHTVEKCLHNLQIELQAVQT